MRSRYFLFAREGGRAPLDPRAKLLLLVAINLVMFGTDLEGPDLAPRLLCAAIPFFALLAGVGRRARSRAVMPAPAGRASCR